MKGFGKFEIEKGEEESEPRPRKVRLVDSGDHIDIMIDNVYVFAFYSNRDIVTRYYSATTGNTTGLRESPGGGGRVAVSGEED